MIEQFFYQVQASEDEDQWVVIATSPVLSAYPTAHPFHIFTRYVEYRFSPQENKGIDPLVIYLGERLETGTMKWLLLNQPRG